MKRGTTRGIRRQYLAAHAPEREGVELPEAHTTEYMSREWNVLPAQVARTVTLRAGEAAIIVVTCGDSRLGNRKLKEALGGIDARSYLNPTHSICPAHRRQVGRCLQREVSQWRNRSGHEQDSNYLA